MTAVDVVYNEKCLVGMAKLATASVDAVVTDPPYGLTSKHGQRSPQWRNRNPGESVGGFMGMRWDASVPSVELWREVLRVLKPGGHLLSFGGTRTYHRMAVAIEDAGFEIRDQLAWIYGSGFPKSHNISAGIDKEAGLSRERIRNVRSGIVKTTYAQDKWSREFKDSVLSRVAISDAAKQWDGWGSALKPALEPICLARKPLSESTIASNVLKHGTGALNINDCRILTGQRPNVTDVNSASITPESGRWPSNLILDEAAAEALDEMTGTLKSGYCNGHRNAPKTKHAYGQFALRDGNPTRPANEGGASRFFYVAKASKRERGEGNNHPTVKPLKLIEYLVRLITPPCGIVLDPFMGSGTTALACINEGFHYIGFEQDKNYFEIAQKRIAHHGATPAQLSITA